MNIRKIYVAIAAVAPLALASPVLAQHDPDPRDGDEGARSEEIESRVKAEEDRLRDREEWQAQVYVREQKQRQTLQEDPDTPTEAAIEVAIAREDQRGAEVVAPAGEAAPAPEPVTDQEREHLDEAATQETDPEQRREENPSQDREGVAERIDQ